MCKLYKNLCQKCQISQGVHGTPLMINQGGGKKSGGWESQGGPSHPPDFDRGVAPPPWTPLETTSAGIPGENLSILNISSYSCSDWNLFWDCKILRTWVIMTLLKLSVFLSLSSLQIFLIHWQIWDKVSFPTADQHWSRMIVAI